MEPRLGCQGLGSLGWEAGECGPLAALDCRPLIFFFPWKTCRSFRSVRSENEPLQSGVNPGQSRGLALATNDLYHRKTGLSSVVLCGSLMRWIQQDRSSSACMPLPRLPHCKPSMFGSMYKSPVASEREAHDHSRYLVIYSWPL